MQFPEEKLDEVDRLPPLKNFLTPFAIKEITTPLSLYEQEKIANSLVDKIVQRKKEEDDKYKLPSHLEDVKKLFDPPGKLYNVKLPLMSSLSPRLKKKIQNLPKPNDYELNEVRKIEKTVKSIGGKRIYDEITTLHPLSSAIDVEPPEFIAPVPIVAPSSSSPPKTVARKAHTEDGSSRSKDGSLVSSSIIPPPLANLLVPKFVDTTNVARFESSQYYDTIEANLKRRSEQQQKIDNIFGLASSVKAMEHQETSSGDEYDGVHEQKHKPSTAPKRSTTADSINSSKSISKQKSSDSTSLLHSKTLTSLFSAAKEVKSQLKPFNAKSAKGQSSAFPSSSGSVGSHSGLKLNPMLTRNDRQKEVDYLNEFSAKVKDEIGIDLNAQYNRNRHFKRLLQVVLLHFYMGGLRASMAKWKKYTEYYRLKQQKWALQKILSILTKGLYWKKKQEREHYLKLQKEAEYKRYMDNQRFLNRNAAIITRFIRYVGKIRKIRYMMRLRKSATTIQRRIRGYLARRRYNKARRRFNLMVSCAVMIQKKYRQRLAIRKVILMRKLEFVQGWLAELSIKKSQYQQCFTEHGAEFFIAKAYRTYIIKKKLRKIIYVYRFAKAIVIQRTYRGYRTRKRYLATVARIRAREELERNSATIIQCGYRAYRSRCRVIAMFQHKQEMDELRYEQKIAKLEANIADPKIIWKNKWMKFRTHYLTAAFIERMKYYHRKATIIQRYYRGFHGRNRVFIIRAKKAWYSYLMKTTKKRNAAIAIQRHWRGKRCRVQLKEKHRIRSIVVIQCAYRIHLAWKKYSKVKKLNDNAKRLTRIFRRLIFRYRFRCRYQREQLLGKTAIPLQCFFRRMLAKRRRYEKFVQRRQEIEKLLMIKTKFIHLLTSIQVRIMVETLTKPIHQRYYTVSKQDCCCLGPMQAFFVFAVCGFSVPETSTADPFKVETKLLPTFKVDNSTLIKFLLKIDEMLFPITATAKQMLALPPADSLYNGVYEFVPSHVKELNYISHDYYHGAYGHNGKGLKKVLSTADSKQKQTVNQPKKSNLTVSKQAKAAMGSNNTVPKKTNTNAKPGAKIGNNNNKSNNKPVNSAKDNQDQVADRTALFITLMNGDIPLPRIVKKLTNMEIDLIFNKAKNSPASQGNSTNKLNYAEFLYCLDLLAQLHYEKEVAASNTEGDEKKEQDHLSEETKSNSRKNSDGSNQGNSSRKDKQSSDENEQNEDEEEEEEEGKENEDNENDEPFNLEKFVKKSVKEVNKSNYINRHNLTIKPDEVLIPSNANQFKVDYKMAFLMRLISSFYSKEKFVQEVLLWLERESIARLNLFVIRIQSMFRRKLSSKFVRQFRKIKAEQERLKRIAMRCVQIQKYIRGYVWKRRVQKIAQQTIRKFVSVMNDPYWYNPKTKVKSWEKPKILGPLEAFTLAVPEEGLEYVIKCIQCSYRNAQIYCDQCEDSFCKLCYSSLHCKGQRSKHTCCNIPICPYCQFQMATKSCVTCVVIPPKKGSLSASLPKFQRGTYCDTCFIHEHDSFTKQLEENRHQRLNMKRMMMGTNQAYLLKTILYRKIQTNHQYESLTQTCEECSSLTASWRCFDCQQVYCYKCLLTLHNSMNKRFIQHKVEMLPYYTPKMHVSLTKDINQTIFLNKFNKFKMIARIQRQEHELRQIIKIQSWWRMFFYRKIGLKIMKQRRKKLRSLHRQRLREDKTIRSTWHYYLKDIFGKAPMLYSDNREEMSLKRLPLLLRERGREYVSKNMDDWGWFRTSRTEPRKGIPKQGFQVGDIEDLVDQVTCGGYRMPGKVFVKVGEQTFKTTCDLTNHLQHGHIIRIRDRYFGVIAVTADSIKLNRLWRALPVDPHAEDGLEDDEGEDKYALYQSKKKRLAKEKAKWLKEKEMQRQQREMERQRRLEQQQLEGIVGDDGESKKAAAEEEDDDDEEFEEGEIIYRVPLYKNEYGRLYHRWKYIQYDLTIGNPVVQGSLRAYKSYSLRMMRFALYMMRMNKKNKLHADAQEWRTKAVEYAENARWAQSYFSTGDAMVDLSALSMPNEEEEDSRPLSKSNRKTADARLFDDDDMDDQGELFREDDGEGLQGEDGLDEGSKRIRGDRKIKPSSASSSRRPISGSSVVPSEGGDDVGPDGEGENSQRPKSALKKSSTDASKKKDSKAKDKKGQKPDAEENKTASKRNLFAGSMKKSRKEIAASRQDSGSKSQTERSQYPAAAVDESELVPKIAEKNLKNPKKKKTGTKADKPWYANAEQELDRKEREAKMTPQELAAEAEDWKECIDPMTENIYWLNIHTNEMVTSLPLAIQMKKQLDFEESKNKKSFDDAMRRIQNLDTVTQNRLLLTGIRKR